jgi:hypothetical protein
MQTSDFRKGAMNYSAVPGKASAAIRRVWSHAIMRRRVVLLQHGRPATRAPLFRMGTDYTVERSPTIKQRISLRIAIPLVLVVSVVLWWMLIEVALLVFHG